MKNVILELTRIQKEVLDLAPLQQVRKIVDSISAVVNTDVCTLYLADENGNMELIASHGLTHKGPITIEAGKGLVGLVAQTRHPVNVAVASEHPQFHYIPETEEERFQSFCGVPLVRYGKVIGVLVVQSVEPVALSAENEAFLMTLSSQLALMVDDIPLPHSLESPANVRIPGVRGSSGIGIGRVHFLDHGRLDSVPDSPCPDVEAAISEWHQLLEEVREEIRMELQTLERQVPDSISSIFGSYLTLLSDQSLIARVEDEIRAGNWLPGALRKSFKYFSDLFQSMEDPYLRERHDDIRHLGNKLYNALRGRTLQQQPPPGDTDIVLVAEQVSVSDIVATPVERIQGIVCFQGSSISHSAILANALGIPAVLGTGPIKHLSNTERLIVDGNVGQVIRWPGETLCQEFHRLIEEEQQLQWQLQELRDKPALTQDYVEIRLYTNSGLLADLTPGLDNGAQGIGLYRTEIPFMVRDSFPSEADQIEVYNHVFELYAGKPVYMRTLDIGGDKQLPYFPITEENPALGWRGIRFTLDNIHVLLGQVRSMLVAAGDRGNLNILLPMISAVDELDTFNELLEQALRQLRDEGHELPRPRVGAMIEVPGAICQLPFWASRIDFVSIGSNDLSQYLLALDRNNARVAGRYDHLHPAVIQEIHRTVVLARQHNLPLSLCGEMASDPLAVILLLGMGIRTLSMSAAKLPRIKWLIRSVSIRRTESILQRALKLESVREIRAFLQSELQRILPDDPLLAQL